MICPWLVKTIVQTTNKNSYNDSVRTEHQEFDKCMKEDCPFYAPNANNKCKRAVAHCFVKLPLDK